MGLPLSEKQTAQDHEFWSLGPKVDFNEGSARMGYYLFIVGAGGPPQISEYFGIWVSRAHVLKLLPEDWRQQETESPSASRWIAAEARAMKRPARRGLGIRITDFARKLAHRMTKAAAADRSIRPIKARSIQNKLREWGLWPLTSIK